MSAPRSGTIGPDNATATAWERYLKVTVCQTGPMVAMSVWLRDERLAASWARQGVRAARLLQWWREDRDVPAEAFVRA